VRTVVFRRAIDHHRRSARHPDLRSMYLPATGSGCDPGWTQVDLATGARRPAFGGLSGVGSSA
jgi:hypothetical protein